MGQLRGEGCRLSPRVLPVKTVKCVIFFLFSVATASALAATEPRQGKTFEQALSEVMSGPEFQATENEIRSIQLEYLSKDLVLEPELEGLILLQ